MDKPLEPQVVTPTEGLETLGSSQVVSNIADFLSLDELGISEEDTSDTAVIEETITPTPKEEKPDVIIPIEEPSSEVNLGETDNKSPGSLDYKSVVQGLIDQGIWEGIEAFETENGQVPFEEMIIDKDTFEALMKHNQEEFKAKITTSTVSTEGISEFTQKLISIEKHGGNVQQALEAYQTIKQPLENIDINDPRGQRAVCFLRLQQQGITGEEAKDLIESYEHKGVLETKAVGFKEQLDSAFNIWISKQEEQAQEEDRLYKESLKTYKSTLNEAFKSAKEFGLTETHRRKLIDIATKEKEDGSFELDTLIDNHRRNPLDAAELVLFITDKESYLKNKSKLLLEEERKSTLKTINIIPVGKSGVNLGSKGSKTDDIIMSLDKL